MTTAPPNVSPLDSPDPASASAARCPVRKLTPERELSGPAVERVGDGAEERWVIRSFEVARKVMRDSESVRQAGFGADQITRTSAKMRPPILYLEGPQHRAQRKAAARFFAPKVTEDYRQLMEAVSAELVSRLRTDQPTDLSDLSLEMAVQVAARVIGLTNSSVVGMSRRLGSFFDGDSGGGARDPRSMFRLIRSRTTLLRFFYLDVKPAIRARRRRPREDVISQLLEQGFNDFEILTECVTYGAAGMATTREFITVAAWHVLSDPDLLSRYREATMPERLDILNETLRLEPVVGHLYRRTTAPVTVSSQSRDQELPVDSLIDLDIRAINADADTVGAEPLRLCPARELGRSVPPTMMSFGDGNHKCPGAPLAIMETEVFLTTLLRHHVVADGDPRIRWNAVTQGYELDHFHLRLRRSWPEVRT